MGLVMLILIGILPGIYSLNLSTDPAALSRLTVASQSAMVILENHDRKSESTELIIPQDAANNTLSTFLKSGKITDRIFPSLIAESKLIMHQVAGKTSLNEVAKADRGNLRSNIYLLSKSIGKLNALNQFTNEAERKTIITFQKQLDAITDFIPNWVKVAVAVSLGLGTTIGWKRIVVTVGEKIGKEHLTYAQGASAELVAMGTIIAADRLGLPVSTTHVLSSGVAGTMAANGSGVQMKTVRNILMAWVLTLPATIFLGALTFAGGLYIAFRFMP
jgi:PiT family inorganic phosphate transporter